MVAKEAVTESAVGSEEAVMKTVWIASQAGARELGHVVWLG